MDLATLCTLLNDAFLGATFGYLIEETVKASKRMLKKIGVLERDDLYSIWEEAVQTALIDMRDAKDPLLVEVDVKKLVEDFEKELAQIEVSPLRISTENPPSWMFKAFYEAISNQTRITFKQSNRILEFVITVVQIRLHDKISQNEKLFKEHILVESKRIREAIELITPSMPLLRKDCEELEKTYVPPAKFKRIKRILKDKGVLILSGPPHVGKSFTARKLLLDYAYEGYEPLMVSPTCEISFLVKLLRMNDRRTVLIDDVYGKSMFEREFGQFMEYLSDLLKFIDKDHKVIVTSRSDILAKAHEMGRLEDVPIERYLVELSPEDYSDRTRERILSRLIKHRKIDNKTLRFLVNQRRFIVRQLQFPHNLRWFVDNYLVHGIKSLSQLRKAVENSRVIEKEVIRIYRRGTREERLVVGVLSILHQREIFAVVKEEDLKKSLRALKSEIERRFPKESTVFIRSPRKVIKKFEEYGILSFKKEALRLYDYRDAYWAYEFRHPTYFEAITKSFVKDSNFAWILKILAHKVNGAVGAIVLATLGGYEGDPGQLKLVVELANDSNKFIRSQIPEPLLTNLYMEPKILTKTLLHLAKDRNWQVRSAVAKSIASNFENANNELLEAFDKLLDDPRKYVRRKLISHVILQRLSVLKSNRSFIEHTFIKLSKDPDDEVRKEVAYHIVYLFRVSPKIAFKLLAKLAKDNDLKVRSAASHVFGRLYTKSPKEVSKYLLDIFSRPHWEPDFTIGIRTLFKTVIENFNVASKELKNVFRKFVKSPHEKIRGEALFYIIDNFDKVSGETREAFEKLIRDPSESVRSAAADAIHVDMKFGFGSTHPEFIEILLTLSKDRSEKVRRTVTSAVRNVLDFVPMRTREDISKLPRPKIRAPDETSIETSIALGKILTGLADNVHYDIQKELLEILFGYHRQIPKKILHNCLVKLTKNLNKSEQIDYRALILLGGIHCNIFLDYDKAYKCFKEAREMDPINPEAKTCLAEVSLALERISEAQRLASEVLEELERMDEFDFVTERKEDEEFEAEMGTYDLGVEPETHYGDIANQKCVAAFIVICSYIFQGRNEEGLFEIEKLVDYRQSLTKLPFHKRFVWNWIWDGLPNVIEKSEINDNFKVLLLLLMAYLEGRIDEKEFRWVYEVTSRK